MKRHSSNCWLINTGWTGGPYGAGSRIRLAYTRAMVAAALEGKLKDVEYRLHEVFGMAIPASCPGVPDEILDPKNTWKDKAAYDAKAKELAAAFLKNFEKFTSHASPELLAAAPRI